MVRVFGAAKLLRVLARRWLGGLVDLEAVQVAVWSGELELLNVALSGARVERFLEVLGVRGRAVAARARASPSAAAARGASAREAAARRALAADDRAAARATARNTATSRCVAESVGVVVRDAGARALLPGGGSVGLGVDEVAVEAAPRDASTAWTKTVACRGLCAYRALGRFRDGDGVAGDDAARLGDDVRAARDAALDVPAAVVLRPCGFEASLRLFRALSSAPPRLAPSLSSGSDVVLDEEMDAAQESLRRATGVEVSCRLRGALRAAVRDGADAPLARCAGSVDARAAARDDGRGRLVLRAEPRRGRRRRGVVGRRGGPGRFAWVARARRDAAPVAADDAAMPNRPPGDWAFLDAAADTLLKVAVVGDALERVDASLWCARVDGVLNWPVLGRLIGAWHDLRGDPPDAAPDAAPPPPPATRPVFHADFATVGCRFTLPYEWERDRGAVVLGWDRARGTVDTTLDDPTLGSYADAEAFLESCLVAGEERGSDLRVASTLFSATCESAGFYVTETAPLDYDALVDAARAGPSFAAGDALRPTLEPLEGCALTLGVSRLADRGTLRVGVVVVLPEKARCRVLVDGPRLSRIFAILGDYLGGVPPLDATGDRLPPREPRDAESPRDGSAPPPPRATQVEIRLVVPTCDVSLLGAPRETPELARCCLVRVRGLRIATRQRDRGDVGYRGQRYAFDDVFIDVRDERDLERDAARASSLIEGTGGGAFEYFARPACARRSRTRSSRSRSLLGLLGGFEPKTAWTYYREDEPSLARHSPAAAPAPKRPPLRRGSSSAEHVERALGALAGDRCADAAAARRRHQLLRKATSRSKRSLHPHVLRRVESLSHDELRSVARLEYDFRDYDVVVASRAEKRPLVRCRGDLVYATDDDNVGAFEKYLTVKACRVDAYRVRSARWEPLVEPGFAVELASSLAPGRSSRGAVLCDEPVECTLTVDAARALRALARGDALGALEVPGATSRGCRPARRTASRRRYGDLRWRCPKPLPCARAAALSVRTFRGRDGLPVPSRPSTPTPRRRASSEGREATLRRSDLHRRARAFAADASSASRGVDLRWVGVFDDRGALRISLEAALSVENAAASASWRRRRVLRRPGRRPGPALSDARAAPLADVALGDAAARPAAAARATPRRKLFAAPPRLRRRRRRDAAPGRRHGRCARLDARRDRGGPWAVARVSAAGRRYCLARVDAPEGLAAGARRRPRRVSLKAPLVIRNALPVAVDVRVLALAPPGDGGRGLKRNSDDFATPRPRDAGARRRARTASRGGRERCVVRRATLESGGLLAVAEADVTDYVWLATRGPASSSWSVVKLNARSWRRRVAAARALGQAPPARRKAAEEDASSFVVAVESAEDVAGPADQRGAAPPAADPAFFGGGAFALDVTLAAPAVVVDRSGLAPGFLHAARGYEARRVGAEAFAEAAPGNARGAARSVSCDAFGGAAAGAAAPRALAWVRDDAEDARFLRDPATTQILTVGGDASVVPGFRASHLVSVEASCDATLVVAFDARATCRPLWLMEGGFGRRPSAAGRRTARIFASDGAKAPVRFDLYEKDVAPGDVCKLGCVTSRGDAKSRARDVHMYAAFLVSRGAAATMNDFSDHGDASSDDGDSESDGASSYYESALEEEAAGDEFFDCVDNEARAAPARAAARVHLLSSADALVVAGGGATFAGAAPPPRRARALRARRQGAVPRGVGRRGGGARRRGAAALRRPQRAALPPRRARRRRRSGRTGGAGAASAGGRPRGSRRSTAARCCRRWATCASTPTGRRPWRSRTRRAAASPSRTSRRRKSPASARGAGDDFGTLLCVGLEDAAVAAPLVSVANETDVLVAVWQAGAAPRYWLVGPRSAAPFGWDDPSARDRRVAVVALANRSRADAAARSAAPRRQLAPLAAAATTAAGDGPDGEPYVDHAALADGGVLAISVRGVVVVARAAPEPWVAKWAQLRATKVGRLSLLLSRGDAAAAARDGDPGAARRVELGTVAAAAALRAKLRAVGVVVERGDDDDDDGDDDDDDGGGGDAAPAAAPRGAADDGGPPAPWLEAAIRRATASRGARLRACQRRRSRRWRSEREAG
ncbi:hypothetical protein JL720_4648 [Aureococcus anophagefferens]|nr:hypothetical protein JL720_4648 [Aureococcus anophagefferens]